MRTMAFEARTTVVIHVSDWERSNTFYRDVLGAEIVPRGPFFVDFAWLSLALVVKIERHFRYLNSATVPASARWSTVLVAKSEVRTALAMSDAVFSSTLTCFWSGKGPDRPGSGGASRREGDYGAALSYSR